MGVFLFIYFCGRWWLCCVWFALFLRPKEWVNAYGGWPKFGHFSVTLCCDCTWLKNSAALLLSFSEIRDRFLSPLLNYISAEFSTYWNRKNPTIAFYIKIVHESYLYAYGNIKHYQGSHSSYSHRTLLQDLPGYIIIAYFYALFG
jgi:hypothetical protein